MPPQTLKQLIELCRDNQQLMLGMADIYTRADQIVRQSSAQCLGGGACCRFDLAAHRPYASLAEIAMLTLIPPPAPQRLAMRRCPYQLGPRCTGRQNRPLGCRVFFCEAALTDWCTAIYEKFHAEIRQLHDAAGAPYRYVELTAALSELVEAGI